MKFIIHLLLFFFWVDVNAQQKIKASEILLQAELKRMPWQQMSMYAKLHDSTNNGSSINSYHIFFSDNKTLIECTEPPSQKGNVLLLLNQELWFYIHSTTKPVKITPLQRLSGSVSFVDMARLNWAKDYITDSIQIVNFEGSKMHEAYLLNMHAVSQEISYRKINLWIDKMSKKPLRADIYLSSEKIYKTILFTKYQVVSAKEINTTIEFIDHFNKERKSVIDFSKIQQEKKLPENYFLKEKLPEVSKEMISDN